MIVPQTVNTPLAGFHSSSIICQATKLLMEDLRDTRHMNTEIYLEQTGFFYFV